MSFYPIAILSASQRLRASPFPICAFAPLQCKQWKSLIFGKIP